MNMYKDWQSDFDNFQFLIDISTCELIRVFVIFGNLDCQ